MIIIDEREPIEIDSFILQADGNARRETLDAGDFMSGDYIIERKTYPDFEKRLTTEKISIWRQLDAMKAAANDIDYTPILLIEGESNHFSGVYEQSFAGAFSRIVEMGIVVVPTLSKASTAQFVVNLDDESDHSVESVRQSPSLTPEERPQHLAEGLPKVGPERAVALLSHFGTFRRVVTATEGELQAVDGIGPKTAEHIYKAINRETE